MANRIHQRLRNQATVGPIMGQRVDIDSNAIGSESCQGVGVVVPVAWFRRVMDMVEKPTVSDNASGLSLLRQHPRAAITRAAFGALVMIAMIIAVGGCS